MWEKNGRVLPFIWCEKYSGGMYVKVWGAMIGVDWGAK
jgi:hypothetical protein